MSTPETVECRCGKCGKSMAAPGRLAGKRVKCPDCGSPVTVPLADAHADQSPETPRRDEEIAKLRRSLSVRTWIGIAGIAAALALPHLAEKPRDLSRFFPRIPGSDNTFLAVDAVTARLITVRDSSGAVRATLAGPESDDDGPLLTFFDEAGNKTVEIGMRRQSNGVFVREASGEAINLSTVKGRQPSLALSNDQGKADTFVRSGESGGLLVLDEAGNTSFELGKRLGGSPMLLMRKASSEPGLQLGVQGGTNGVPFITSFAKDGRAYPLLRDDGSY